MAKGKNDGSIEMGSRKPAMMNRLWVRTAARNLGLKVTAMAIVGPDGELHADDSFTREAWNAFEALVIAARNGITREIDPEHLTQEEQADLVASQMTLRGSKTQLRGALTKLEGLMMRPNALLQPDRIDAVLKEVEDLAKNARDEVAKFRKAS